MTDRPDHTALLGKTDRELLMICSQATHQHYKGGLYRLLGPVRDSETGEVALAEDGSEWITYLHVYPHAVELWRRPASEFFSEAPEMAGLPRFRRIGGGAQRLEDLPTLEGRVPGRHTEAEEALERLRRGSGTLPGHQAPGERKRHLRLWQAANTLQLFGLWHEVRLNAMQMDEATFIHWMNRRFPRNGHNVSQEDAAAGKFNIYDILPTETDW